MAMPLSRRSLDLQRVIISSGALARAPFHSEPSKHRGNASLNNCLGASLLPNALSNSNGTNSLKGVKIELLDSHLFWAPSVFADVSRVSSDCSSVAGNLAEIQLKEAQEHHDIDKLEVFLFSKLVLYILKQLHVVGSVVVELGAHKGSISRKGHNYVFPKPLRPSLWLERWHHRKVFWDVSVRAPGGTDDSTHLRESSLFEKLTSAQVLTDSVITIWGHQLRPYLAGDWCYPLISFLLVPFSSNGSGTPAQNLFDATLIRGKSVVEQAIGLLKGCWRMLQDMNVGLSHTPQTIVACCVLHNLYQLSGEPEPFMCRDPWENGPAARTTDSDKYISYFGETLRQALLEDFQEGHQRVSMR